MKTVTRKITTAAVCTALAVIMCVCTVYLPLSFMPLYLAAFCIYLACERAGAAYGLLGAIATAGLMFIMSGLSVKWLAFLLMFAPYAFFAFFMRKFDYFKLKRAAVRGVCALLFFNAAFGAQYAIAVNVATVGMDIDVGEWSLKLGGYAVLAVIMTAVMLPLDFILTAISPTVLRRIPAIAKPAARSEDVREPESRGLDDVFGYEVFDCGNADPPQKGGSDESGDNTDPHKSDGGSGGAG